jgi:putative ABC transport system permease protein
MLNGLEDELRDHIERETNDNIERGMTHAAARAAALRKFGNVARVAEETRSVWTPLWLQQFFQDVRHGIRTLLRSPGFTVVVLLTLALGVGMNTAVFSVVNAVLVRPLPYPDAERLVWIADYNQMFKSELVAGPDYFDWKAQAKSFDEMVGYGYMDASLAAGDDAEQNRIAQVSDGFWRITGARPAIGHLFGAQERDALVLSDQLFERRFHRDAAVIGRAVTLDGQPRTIVGVLPKDFRFLLPRTMGWLDDAGMDAYVLNPVTPESQVRGRNMAVLNVVAKLKPGVAIGTARAELEGIQARIARENPRGFYDLMQLRVTPVSEKLVGGARRALLVLLSAVGFVLLIACANIANLLLARASTRQREIAIRAAVGAGRARVVRQFLGEGLLLGALGGLAGLLLARAAIVVIVRLAGGAVPRLAEANIDGRVFAFDLAVSLLAGVAFGVSPAFASWGSKLHDVLKEGGRSYSASPAGLRVRKLLVAVELVLAIVLLTGAGLMVKSFWRMNAHAPGFNPERVLTMKVSLSGQHYSTQTAQQAYVDELLRRVSSAPGVEAAGITNTPVRGVIQPVGAPPLPPLQAPQAAFNTVSAGYAAAVGMRLLEGRWLTDNEPTEVVTINESLARAIFGNVDPIGKSIRLPRRQPAPNGVIVGIVADLKTSKLDAPPGPEMYMPYKQSPFIRAMTVTVRTSRDPAAVASGIRALIANVDRTQPVYEIKTLEQALADSIAPRRFNLFLLGTFAATALGLALIGIYGVIAYSVTQRTHEIGVRVALGASRWEVIRMVVGQGMGLAAAGIVCGAGAAVGLMRLMTSLLYDVTPTDPATFAAVAALLAATALMACFGPALRAARVDPALALRHE